MNALTTSSEQTIDSVDGVTLFVRTWRPVQSARAVVIVVPGFKSHSRYYEWIATRLIKSNLAVYAVDLRGRGNSGGERYFIESFSDYVNDVHAVVNLARTEHKDVPVYLLGHSAGGVVAAEYALKHVSLVAGVITESAAFQVPAPDFALAAIKGISRLLPRTPILKLPHQAFSRDPDAVRTLDEDVLVAEEVQPAKTIAEMVRANERLRRESSKITLPLLILHGTADSVTKESGSQWLYEAAGSRDKTFKRYEGHFHDLLNDVGREQVAQDLERWISERLQLAGHLEAQNATRSAA